MRRARRARHAWRDEPRAESGRSAQPACGERVRGSCRGTCAASSPRRAPRAGQRIKFILAPPSAPFIPRIATAVPGYGTRAERGVSAARRARRRSIPGRVTSPATSTPETPPPPRRGVHRGRSVSDRTPVNNRPRGRPVRRPQSARAYRRPRWSTARFSQMTTIYQLAIRVLGWQIGNRMRLRAI